jgi:hypothetical protein
MRVEAKELHQKPDHKSRSGAVWQLANNEKK